MAVLGDSQLIIQFMTRQATPRRAHLANKLSLCQAICKSLPVKVHVLFVPREQNRWADWLSKVGAKVESLKTIEELGVEVTELLHPPRLQAHTSLVG